MKICWRCCVRCVWRTLADRWRVYLPLVGVAAVFDLLASAGKSRPWARTLVRSQLPSALLVVVAVYSAWALWRLAGRSGRWRLESDRRARQARDLLTALLLGGTAVGLATASSALTGVTFGLFGYRLGLRLIPRPTPEPTVDDDDYPWWADDFTEDV